MKQLRFLHSPVAANIIALLAFLTSVTGVVYSCKQQRFTESSYSEEKRGSIRLLLHESELQLKQSDEELASAFAAVTPASPAYPVLIRRKERIDEMHKDLDLLSRALDRPVFTGDPKFWNFMESSLKVVIRSAQTSLEGGKALDAQLNSRPSPSPNKP